MTGQPRPICSTVVSQKVVSAVAPAFMRDILLTIFVNR